jgi:hypothetical protein
MWVKLPGDRYLNTLAVQYFDLDISTASVTLWMEDGCTTLDLQGDQAMAFVSAIEGMKRLPVVGFMDMSLVDAIALQTKGMD